MTFFTFLRFTKQQNMLQQQLKEATVGTKTLKGQPYLELKRIRILGPTHKAMNYFCLMRFVGFWLKYMLKNNVDRSSQVYFLDSNSVAVELLPSFKPKLKHVGDEMKL